MAFNSISYFLFLPAVYLIFHAAGNKWRWTVLVSASAYFYLALQAPHLMLALGAVCAVSYLFGILTGRSEQKRARKALLWCGIAANLLILIFFKYLPPFAKNLALPLGRLSVSVDPSLIQAIGAIGVSYYVFQAISYLADVYSGKQVPERHIGYFALYLSFFPKLLQGPIERAGDLLPQLKKKYEFDYETARIGLLTFAGGLFKKVVIADRLAQYVDPVYNSVHSYSGVVFVLATYLYALQLYFDFSGYTDMALGSARLFNIRLTQNFNSPYLATSISDFWRRWHISLSQWLRDYLYIPLGGSRVGTVRRAFNLTVVFTLCGIWHGASWTFLVWGLLHGLYLVASVLYRPLQARLYAALNLEGTLFARVWRPVVTFHLVCFGWIFFRANTLSDAWYVISHMFSDFSNGLYIFELQEKTELYIAVFSLMLIFFASWTKRKTDLFFWLFKKPLMMRWAVYYSLLLSILFWGSFKTSHFIYFKF